MALTADAVLLPIDRRFDDAQIFVQCFHYRTSIYVAWRSLLKLLSESPPVRAEILESFTIFQAQIAIHNQLHASVIMKYADQLPVATDARRNNKRHDERDGGS